jgi:hypothetical protein
MTASDSKQSEKSLSVQTIRLTRDQQKTIKHHLAEVGESFQSFALRLIERELRGAIPAAPDSKLTSILSPIASLSPDDQWTITNLIEIIHERPQGPIFHLLDHCLAAAIKEYRSKVRPGRDAEQKPRQKKPLQKKRG